MKVMLRKERKNLETRLARRGVYKPYVTSTDVAIEIESYPLEVRVTDGGTDPQKGPLTVLTLNDWSLRRENNGGHAVQVRTLTLGQDVEQHAATLLNEFHEAAHKRAVAQDCFRSARA